MKGKNYLLSGLIALFIIFGLIAPQAAEARDIIINATPTLAFDPATATATTCGTVDVNVRVNDVVNLTAYHLEVTYDRTKVQVVEVVNGGFLTAPGMTELYEPTNTVDDGTGTGRILWGMAQQGTDGNPVPKSGSGNLITIRLKSLAVAGTTTLTIDGTTSMLVDWPDAQSIGYTVAGNTTVTLQSCAPTDIALSSAAVDENKPVGTVVGTLSATDPDAGDTTFSYMLVNPAGYPENARFQIVGNALQTSAVFDYETKASYQINVRVTGPHGLTYDELFTVTVNDVNEAPVLAAIANATIPELLPVSFTATATDADLPAQALTFSLVDAPTGGAITTAGAFTWTPTEEQGPGVYTFTVKVCDDGTPALCDEQSVTLTVTEDNVAPVAEAQSVETAEDTAKDITLVATDVDGNTLTYAIVAQPAHGSVTLVGNVATYTPAANHNGSDSFTFKANDGMIDSNVATVSITVTSVNDAPVLTAIGPQTVANTGTLTFTPTANDVDGNPLTWSLGDGAPTGATINPTTGTFNWAPSTSTVPGDYDVTICVSDGTDQDCETITITVTDGVAPVMEAVTPAEGHVYLAGGENFVLTVDALDDNLYSLEIDHSMEDSLPEFSVYASESDPYGGDEAAFATAGVTVTYNATTQTWVIDFGASITNDFIDNPNGITFYMVLKDMAGNQWGTMYGPTPENTYEYNLIRDDVAPVMEAVTPAEGDVYLAGGENFVLTVDAKDTNLYSLEIDHSMEDSLPEFSVYASESDPYGGDEAAFAALGVSVTYNATTQTWVIDFGASITNAFIDNPNGITFYMVLKDMAGNQWGTMYGTTPENTYEYNLIRDDVDPQLISVTPPHNSTVLLGIGDTFTLTIEALDDNLRELEIDHSMEGTLPEFSVYASESDPYGGDEADFAELGVSVTYNATTQTWVVDFGAGVSAAIANNGGITFYLVLEDMAGNTWGSMSPTTSANTFKYTVSQDLVVPTIEDMVANGAGSYGDVSAVGTTFTVDQGYTVESISITMSEPVQVALGTIVTMEGYGPYGTVTANVGGVITITPYPVNTIAALIGSFTFTVPAGSVTDMSGNPFTGSIGLEVLNVAPVAVDDVYSVAEDGILTVPARGVLTNDTDFDPSILTAVLVTGPANGTLVLNADGSFTYTPAANFNGTDTFTYKANDGLIDSNDATVTITVTSINDTPVLGTIEDASIPELVEFSFTATATDADLPAQPLTFSLVGAPEGAAITSAGVFTWTPSELQGPGVYTFTVKVCDDATPALCDEQEVTLTVTEVNVAPVASDLTVTTPEDTPLDITLVATDVDGNTLTYVIVAQPTHGTVTLVGNVATYTPALDYHGPDSFTFKANDGTIDSNVATVTITVTPLNDTPIAVDDFYTMDEDTTLTIAVPGVMANDSDVDLDIMEVVLVTDVQNGNLSLFGNGSFVYVPDPDFFGTDTFVYRLVTYPGPQSSWIDEAIVTITVNPINDAPVLGTIANATIPELVAFTFTATATDVDLPAQVLTFSLVGAPEGAAITAAGVFTWTPTEAQGAGVYTFTVKVCDDATPALCDEQAVTLTVTEVNTAPVAQPQTVTTPEENAVNVTLVATDAQNDPLTYAIVAQPAHGTVTLVGTTATYTPNLDYFGPDSFTFKANDGLVDSNVATVTITVTNVNDAPVAIDDEYTVAEKATLTVAAPGVLDNDTDVDGDTLSAILVDGVLHGMLTLNADGSFTYTPNAYFNGTDSFTYKAKDAALESDLAVVTITVTPVNDWPIANDDFYEVLTGNDLVKDAAEGVLANDVLLDPDEQVSIQILEGPQHGTLSMNNDGSFTYTPDAGYMGTDTFRYMVLSVRAINAEWSDDALVIIMVKPYMGLFLPIIWR